ncbi:uncharacterized protein BYT42DRAFT_514840 [Radiomyces spectabilis]|uniref:uncharacterized protein n=1 Tax=Radiomyces spectabilis TaxID=64574 RepID=UPI00221FF4B0|nr:uncharacterized protein BYT42DRAFT_514840 [Radiomyces spectabilis]KAI8379499.1 hypothetical protein BYT42DRAFT_514840 [Radiomyces spectabilis]
MTSASSSPEKSIDASSATTKYHAQLYSGQKQLQKRQLQQKGRQEDSSHHHPTLSNGKPAGPPSSHFGVLAFEPPNLYRTSLRLTTERDIHPWWTTLVDILSDSSFHATRITLSIPQDPDDPYSTPWGLKAVYNKRHPTAHSDDNSDHQARSETSESSANEQNEGDYFLHNHIAHEKPAASCHIPWCFDRLQPFESEPEPLIHNPSVQRILKRNATVILSREYRQRSQHPNSLQPRPLLKSFAQEDGHEMFRRALLEQTEKSSRRQNWNPPVITTPCLHKLEEGDGNDLLTESEILVDASKVNGGMEDGTATTATTPEVGSFFMYDYDEYEQQQPSPWSQSPAPSPAMMDPDVNPFFLTPPDIDDDAFNPVSPETYNNTSIPFPPPASNVHSVVHIPLVRPSDADLHASSDHNSHRSSSVHRSPCSISPPIAILSFLTPVVPYPPVLINSLNSLSPFIANSFANAMENSRILKQNRLYRHPSATRQRTRPSVSTTTTDSPATTTIHSSSSSSSAPKELDPNDSSLPKPTPGTDTDSAMSTPTVAAYASNANSSGPTYLAHTSHVMRSSLETVTEHNIDSHRRSIPHSINELANDDDLHTTGHSSDVSSSSFDSAFSVFSAPASFSVTHASQPGDPAKDQQHPIYRKIARQLAGQTTMSSTCPSCGQPSSTLPDAWAALSPSSAAILEGWDAISPTTGLPIRPSIPPRSMCSKTGCSVSHRKPKPSEVWPLSTDQGRKPSRQNKHTYRRKSENLPQGRSSRPVIRKKRKGISSRPSHRRSARQWQDIDEISEDDGFHYHHSVPMSRENSNSSSKNDGFEPYLVAPKSSLLRLVIDGIPIHVFTCSTVTGQVIWVNNRILQYTGRSLQEHLGPHWLSHMHPDDREKCQKTWDTAFEQGNGFAGEYRLRRFDGMYRCFLWRIVPLRNLKGRIIHWFGSCTDVHDQHMAQENNLRQIETVNNERKYRLLAEAIPQIVFTLLPGIGLTYANGNWESYSGQDLEKTMGLGFMSQVHPEDRQKLQLPDLVPENMAGIAWHNEVRLLSSQGDYRWFLVKCVSVDESNTGDIRWFGTCTDINDQKLLEHKLKEAHDAAQKSTESKTRFLSNMSHEIRTPLIGITGMLNFLLDTELTAEQMDYAHTIQQSAESLLVVINDILDLSKVEAGMMKLEWEPFSLMTMIEDANELLSTLAIQKGLELSFWVDEDVPDVVIGDRVRLRQVLLNLIGNAIKFTSVGEIFTQCTLQKTEGQEAILLFEVVDTGAGFDAEGEAVIFKPFSQVDNSSTRKHGGSGLGLVISRQLIELHGGRMSCKSEKGKGSTFYFTAKFGIPTGEMQPRPHTPQHETSNDPFFRTNNAYAITHDASPVHPLSQEKSDSTNLTASPLAHSLKHSQANGAPNSVELLHDALMNKAASMRLVVPPARNGKLSPPVAEKAKQRSQETKNGSLGNGEALSSKPWPNGSLISPNMMLPPRTPLDGRTSRVLLVSEWPHARETLAKHIRSLLGNMTTVSGRYHLDVMTNHLETIQFLVDPHTAAFDYIVINLSSEQHILTLTRSICSSFSQQEANVVIVTTPMQRSMIVEKCKALGDGTMPQNCAFVFKPIKRSKINWFFGIRHGQSGKDHQETTAPPDAPQRRAATQKEIFRKMEADVGGRGFRVLLVEDNLVNQKVLTRYLARVGLEADVAADGKQGLDMFLAHPHDYYSLILCDLFMPVKDGYETTKEIREWEAEHLETNTKRIPIVALSANVMSDVASKCLASGFTTYISKPVNFAVLSDVIRSCLL